MPDYTEYADIFDMSDGQEVGVTEHRENALGVQAELEERMEAWAVEGVISGGAPSITGTEVAIADLDAYAAGKRYQGADSLDFAGEGANTYHLYLDPTDDTTPLKAKAVAVAPPELWLADVDWNGAALANLYDRRRWGIYPIQLDLYRAGAVTATVTAVVGTCCRDFYIESVQGGLLNTGTGGGPTRINIKAGANLGAVTSIWVAATADMLAVTAGDANGDIIPMRGEPDATNRLLSAGDLIVAVIELACTGAVGPFVSICGRYV